MRNKPDHPSKHLWIESIIAGIGAFIGLSLLGMVAQEADTMMIIAPFGATAVLLFSVPHSPFSRSYNIFGGYLISTLIAVAILYIGSADWLAVGIGLGLVIMLMHLTQTIHPPAGANFLIVVHGSLDWYLIEPLLLGLMTLMIVGMSVEKIKQRFYR